MNSKNINIVVVLIFLFSNNLSFGNNTKQNLQKINKTITEKKLINASLEKENKKIQDEITSTQKKLVKIAGEVKKYEGQFKKYDNQLYELYLKEKTLQKKIAENNKNLVNIIATFQNIAEIPKGYLFFKSDKITSYFNDSLLFSSLIETLDKLQTSYNKDLESLGKLRTEIISAKNSIKQISTKVKNEKNKIDKLIKDKKQKQIKLTNKQKETKNEIAKLIIESKTIEELIKKTEERKKRQRQQRKSRVATGNNPLPVVADIETYFGEKRKQGITSKGIYLKAKQGMQVISPTDAEVMFSGTLQGFKNLLILHSHDDYYIIIGGLNERIVDEGQNLLAGEPIGETGDGDFYIEIRDKTTPINPLTYFKI